MDDEEREHYNKLFRFTFGISLDVLHHYFEIRVLDKEEFFVFLDRCKHVLFHALHPTVSCCECRNGSIPLSKKPPTLRFDQFNLLFDIENSTLQCLYNKTDQNCRCKYSASRSVKVDSLDISLVYAIIKTCCPSIHGNPQWIKDVKDTRNFLSHKSNCQLTKDEYDTWLNTVEKATLDLAKVVSSTFLKMIQKQISDFKKDVQSSNTVKDILASSNDDVCKRLESIMKNLVTQVSKSMSKDIIDHIQKYIDISIDINELKFEVKTHICEQLPSQKNIEESGETGYATSTPQTAQPESTQSKNENKCRVEWKLATSDTWNVSKIKNTLQHLSGSLEQWFEIEFVYIGSLVIGTKVPEHILSNYDAFKSAVRSFLAKIVEACQLDTDTPTVVKVDLSIFTEIPPTEISTNVNKEHKKSTLTSPCHYCKEELVCDNCTTNGRIELPVSSEKLSISGFKSDSDSVTCNICGKTFGTERSLQAHQYYFHTVPCDVCGMMLETKSNLHIHHRCLYKDFTRKRMMIEEDDSDYISGRMSSDLLEETKLTIEKEISMLKGQIEKMVPTAHMEKKLDYQPFAFDISTTGSSNIDFPRRHHVEIDRLPIGSSNIDFPLIHDVEIDRLPIDISKKSKLKMQMEMSMPKGQMEKSMPKAQMQKTIDYNRIALDISTTDDPMIDEQIGKREDVHPIRLEHDTNVPKSSDVLRRWDMKDKDDSISSTEKH